MLPLKTLSIYVAKMFLLRFVAILLMLVLVIQSLDLVNESDKVLAAPGANYQQLLQYIAWRLPQLGSLFTPFAVLLATLMTLITLNQNSEVVIMKASGLSAHQILMPLFLAAALVAGGHFLFNEYVLAQATAKLTAWQDTDYGLKQADGRVPRPLWVLEQDRIIHATKAHRRLASGGGVILEDVELYDRISSMPDRQGKTGVILRAKSAELVDQRLTLHQVLQTDLTGLRSEPVADRILRCNIPPEQFLAETVDPKVVGYGELRRAINDLNAGQQTTNVLLAALYHKISGPVSALLMPLLAGVAAFGVARSGKLFLRLAAGLGIGFAYFVADNFMLAMGQFGTVPPWAAAWAPFALFFLIGETILLYSEE